MEKNEMYYIEKIFKAIPQMSDFEKGRLFGIAEEMERAASSLQIENKPDDYARESVSLCEVQKLLGKNDG